MCEAFEIGRDLVHFVNVDNVISNRRSEMRCLRGRQGLGHAQLGCYISDFAFYTNTKEEKEMLSVFLTDRLVCTEKKSGGQQWKW